ncbi:hypothetical protein [Catellatospora sp. NPDC049133]|jgi:hypothetical protein|uniref:hypothetical protein n=1 Tax=Catellatospora sp. NPDC049133 TaxID=3155499 RepID=UPI0033EAA1E6
MARQLKVDGGVINGVSSRLVAVGDEVAGAREKLVSGINALGQPWGRDDEFARKFVAEYGKGRDEVVEGSANLAALLKNMGEHIKRSGRSFGTVEGS